MGHQVSAIILAAGSSRRMGRLKQLLPLGGKPVLSHTLDTIVSSGIGDVIVVVSPGADEIARLIDDLRDRQTITPHAPAAEGGSGDARIVSVTNNDADSDMAGSVRVGLREVDAASSGVLVCLADQPLVTVETIVTLLRLHQEDPGKILVPCFKGKKGHPPLFPRERIEEISSSPTLRDIINRDRERIRLVDIPDEGVLIDMDTMNDYERIVRRRESG